MQTQQEARPPSSDGHHAQTTLVLYLLILLSDPPEGLLSGAVFDTGVAGWRPSLLHIPSVKWLESVVRAPGGPEARCWFPNSPVLVPGWESASPPGRPPTPGFWGLAGAPHSTRAVLGLQECKFPACGVWAPSQLVPGLRGGCSHSCDDFMTLKWQGGREQGRIVFTGCKQQVWKSLGKTGPPALVLKVTPISSKNFPECLPSPPKPLGWVKSQGGPLQPGSCGRNVKYQTPFRWVCWF